MNRVRAIRGRRHVTFNRYRSENAVLQVGRDLDACDREIVGVYINCPRQAFRCNTAFFHLAAEGFQETGGGAVNCRCHGTESGDCSHSGLRIWHIEIQLPG